MDVIIQYLIVVHHARRLVPSSPRNLRVLGVSALDCSPSFVFSNFQPLLSPNPSICHTSKILPVSEHPIRMGVPSDHRESRDLNRALNPLAPTLTKEQVVSPIIA